MSSARHLHAAKDGSRALPSNLVWFHAVNSSSKAADMHDAIALLAKQAGNDSFCLPIGVEIDVHCIEVAAGAWKRGYLPEACDVAVCRHDAIPHSRKTEEIDVSEMLEEIWTQLLRLPSTKSPVYRLEVVKFDVKTPRAMAALHRLHAQGGIMRRLEGLPMCRVWFNADVLRGPYPADDADGDVRGKPLAELSTTDGFLELLRDDLRRWLVCFGQQEKWGLSLGWTTKASDTTPYGEQECSAMLELLASLGGGPLPLLTFPLRYALVFNAEEGITNEAVRVVQQLLMGAGAIGVACLVFPTFWRSRTESITPAMKDVALATFALATVDTD